MKDPRVIIIIMTHKENLSAYERISFRQCFKVLGHYPITLLCPEGMDVGEYLDINPETAIDFIPPHWQESYASMRRLKTLPFLYKRYSAYDYILFHELDAFVFRDELMEWCNKGYDDVGAPWLEGWSDAKPGASLIGAGNGGFSLRKVRSCLKVGNSFSYIEKPAKLWEQFKNLPLREKSLAFLTLVKKLTIKNNTYHRFNDWAGIRPEDVFWGIVASQNFEWFKVPTPHQAMRFSFETQPRYLYELNQQKLPFGCHAWWKCDLEFWRPFIREFGHDI